MILSKTGITTSNVANILGTTSHNVSTLCTHPNINPWSKYKPVNLKEPCPNRALDWWKGDNGRCGFDIGIKDSAGAVRKITRLDDVPNGKWYYDKVNPNYPKRLADFGGYNDEAYPCIYSGIDKDLIEINTAKGDTYTFAFDLIDQSGEENLSTQDFGFLSEYYFAAAIKGSGTFGHWREFRGTPVLDGGGGVAIDIKNLDNGTYDCILFASTSNNPEYDGDILPLPSDYFNRTSFQIKVGIKFSFDIILDYVGKSLTTSNWTYIDDIPWIDEQGNGGYKCPYSGRLYFKGRVVRTTMGFDRANDMDLKGESESFHGGMFKNGLGGSIYNGAGTRITQVTTPGSNIGDSEEIIIKWDGYVGESEPQEPQPIGGGLSIYFKTAYIGGSSDFDLYM